MRTKVVVGICILLLVQACSNRSVYESLQHSQRQKCERKPSDIARAECQEGLGLDYEDYQQERDKLLSESNP